MNSVSQIAIVGVGVCVVTYSVGAFSAFNGVGSAPVRVTAYSSLASPSTRAIRNAAAHNGGSVDRLFQQPRPPGALSQGFRGGSGGEDRRNGKRGQWVLRAVAESQTQTGQAQPAETRERVKGARACR
ncbi:hypothetical protein BKA56DRAFT_682352 [Ilyonectria sp. MPI-CAGE-AT-0026]|nr:hypothetical protein BKA56DRAFT_682352 [Ilyonectria sp. MPI-CAGE-AT-0026]